MCPKGAEWFSETVVFSSFNWLKHSGFSRAFAWSLQDGEEGAEWMRYLSENRSLRVPAASECPGQRMQQLQFLTGQPRGVPANQPDSVNCHQFNTLFIQRKIKQINTTKFLFCIRKHSFDKSSSSIARKCKR